MTYETLLYAVNNNVCTITMNRADLHNAFNAQMIEEMTDAFEAAGRDEAIRLIILKGAGKSFSAGADLSWMKEMADYSTQENIADSRKLAGLMHTLFTCPKPTLAIVDGAAFGGGVGLVSACDIALATPHSVFCLSEVKLGLIPAVISPYVVKAIGQRQAKRYFLSAEKISAQKALDIGLIHEITENPDDVINALLEGGPQAQKASKELIDHVASHALEELLDYTSEAIARARASQEGQDGIKAFLEKRKAGWL